MDEVKKGELSKVDFSFVSGSQNSHLTCDVCKIDFNSNADFALHEFSKKHCDNLIRLAKQKPVLSKHKIKNEITQVEKQPLKVNSVTHAGSFAKYGYFVPGEIYVHSEISKEFNTDYDPYLQKFAENPIKEKLNIQSQNMPSTLSSATSFSKKKKKKIKTCQVCNITFLTLPEYEAHMKSPQHIWKLKVTGMGVSAHFVKASSDLHTTDINEECNKPNGKEEKEEETMIGATAVEDNSFSGPFPLLYCSDCELLLNSPQQYNAHINGKLHIESAQKKAELKARKEKLENPLPNQLYCYSCKISLNNLFQYNEHKNGKKHKTKCRTLIRKGLTIPPEERLPEMPHPNPNRPVVYPELYEKLILEKQKQLTPKKILEMTLQPFNETNNLNPTGDSIQIKTSSESSFGLAYHFKSNINTGCSEFYKDVQKEKAEYSIKSDGLEMQVEKKCVSKSETKTILQLEVENSSDVNAFKEGKTSNESNTVCQANDEDYVKVMPEGTNSNLKTLNFHKELPSDDANDETLLLNTTTSEESKTLVSLVTDNKPINCSICNENFQLQSQLDTHLGCENHLKKILELKLSGQSESEILKIIFSDRNVIKPNISGKFSCSICNVTTDNELEFDQHLSSIVHRYTEKDYKKKRTLEVKQMVRSNENGLYFCKLCQEGWVSLVEYTQHLHFVKHRSIQRAQRTKVILAKRKNLSMQKQRLMQNVKRNLTLRRTKAEKNPGVRTKICGVATNLFTGTQAPVPNLEPLEPKIDITKNLSIGVCYHTQSYNTDDNNDKLKIPKVKKRSHMLRPSRKVLGAVKQQNHGWCPFIPSEGIIPPLMPRLPFSRYPRPNFIPPNRNSTPFASPQPPVFGPQCRIPFPMGNVYFRPQRILRPPWPKYRPPFSYS